MPRYLLLMKAAEQSALDLLATGSSGLEHQRGRLEALGAKVEAHAVLIGRYDAAAIVDFETEQDCLAAELGLIANGFYTEALRAFSSEDLDRARERIRAIEPAAGEGGR